MKFDRKASGEGVEAVCKLKSDRVFIEWRFSFLETDRDEEDILCLTVKDKDGQMVLLCIQKATEEEIMTSVVLHPHLWSCEDPYLYEVEVVLQAPSGREKDRLKKQLPLRELYYHPYRGWLLNGEELALRAVQYTIPQYTSQIERQQKIWKDLCLLKEMGANCVRVEASLWKLCERIGLLNWQKDMGTVGEELPCPVGEGSGGLSALFYLYKARWSQEPFVYIVPESVSVLPSGNFMVTVYSNSERVALYSDGILFEFRSDEGEFVFREVPAKGPCVMLSAKGEGCSMSFSIHKTFVGSLAMRGACPLYP